MSTPHGLSERVAVPTNENRMSVLWQPNAKYRARLEDQNHAPLSFTVGTHILNTPLYNVHLLPLKYSHRYNR